MPSKMQLDWTADKMLSYMRTWSATQRYIEANGGGPGNAVCAGTQGSMGQRQARRAMAIDAESRRKAT